MIDMVGIDIGDDGTVAGSLQKAAVTFVGLHDHPFAGAQPRIRAVGVDDAAVDDRGIEPAASNIAATIDVVVVLPCVPPPRWHHFRRIISASISARRTMGRLFARRVNSGLSRLTAEE